MKKTSINRWFLLVAGWSLLSNLVHPVTPRHFMELGLKNNMFGWAYAGMAFTNFLFSPTWGKIADKIGTSVAVSIGIIGYSIAQSIFAFTTTARGIMLARLLGGFFVGGVLVAQLMYIVQNSPKNERATAMVKVSTIQIVVGTIGYFVGGKIGDYSIKNTFVIQVVGMIILALYAVFFIGDNPTSINPKLSFTINDVNPFNSIVSEEAKGNRSLQLVMFIMIFYSIGQTSYDQTFNYYMADFFKFPPSVNGTIKSITGVLAFVVNSTLGMWLINNTKINKTLGTIFFIMSLQVFALVSVSNPNTFLAINIIYFIFVSMAQPMIQSYATSMTDDHSAAVGSLNALKSLGMVIGGIFAGQLYQVRAQLPFLTAMFIFILAGIISFSMSKKSSNN